MKRRYGFISNSSSSSFVVICEKGNSQSIPEEAFDENGYLPIPNMMGWYCFGWDTRWYGNILDRINFAFCQLMYLSEGGFPPTEKSECYDYYQDFLRVLENHGIKPRFVLTEADAREAGQSLYADSFDFYIDHQSSAVEGKNLEIFDPGALESFLFNEGSGIQGGNDNYLE